MSANEIAEKLRTVVEFVSTAMALEEVEGFLQTVEGYALNLLAQSGPGEGAIVEIGSFMGLSTCWMALGSKQAGREPVTAIDHFTGSPEHQPGGGAENEELAKTGTTFHRFEANVAQMGVTGHVRPIQAASDAAAATWTEPIRLLFIDGDHSYEAVKSDFTLWTPFVIAGGLVAFHDVGTSPEVTRFYEERKAAGSGYSEYFRLSSLGVLVKRSEET